MVTRNRNADAKAPVGSNQRTHKGGMLNVDGWSVPVCVILGKTLSALAIPVLMEKRNDSAQASGPPAIVAEQGQVAVRSPSLGRSLCLTTMTRSSALPQSHILNGFSWLSVSSQWTSQPRPSIRTLILMSFGISFLPPHAYPPARRLSPSWSA
ncbi:hypothetical protein H4582DRAFT_1951505 [Lactarius indigo]|nr:hypothetical protein H4582DRAFT_1951505 [Lactarius indigo]